MKTWLATSDLRHARHARVLTLATLAVALTACSKPEVAPEPIRAVKVMTVGPQALNLGHEYAGEVKARVESRLSFRVAGKLMVRPAEVGQRVKAGQVLAQLDASDYRLADQAAQAQVQAAVTQRDLAAADLKRYSELRAQNFISSAELERREAAFKAAQATVDQAKAQGQVQGNQKGYTALVADKAGVVLAVEAEPGQVVSAGTPIVRLAYDGPRDVVVALPEHKAPSVKVGTPANVRLWATGETYAAQVREIAASADPVSRTFAVKLSLPANATEVALGSTAYVEWAGRDGVTSNGMPTAAIKLPTSALWQQGAGSAVWVFDKASSTVQARAVMVATADGNQAVIADGLKGGEQVVVAGVHVLAPNQKVTLYQDKHTAKPDAVQVQGQAQPQAETKGQP